MALGEVVLSAGCGDEWWAAVVGLTLGHEASLDEAALGGRTQAEGQPSLVLHGEIRVHH